MQIKFGPLRTASVAAIADRGPRDRARMRLHATPFKWLLIGLLLVSFAGRPWAQSLPASSARCGSLSSAAMEHVYSAAAHDTGDSVAAKKAMPHHESDKAKSPDCVKSCAAAPVLALTATPSWASEIWPHIHEMPVDLTLNGQSPKPELSPPIARV
jgi:hypothetical protein